MTVDMPAVPESCSRCPHLDRFHSTCSHPARQTIIHELEGQASTCPVFAAIRGEEMRQLVDRMDGNGSRE